MQICLTQSAEADLLSGFMFYERQQTGLGEYFLDSLYADIDALMLYAGVHPKPIGRFHRILAKRFPFTHQFSCFVSPLIPTPSTPLRAGFSLKGEGAGTGVDTSPAGEGVFSAH